MEASARRAINCIVASVHASGMCDVQQLVSLVCMISQVTIPIATAEGCPVGLSFIGPPGSDEALLELAADLMGVLKLS